MKQRKWIIGVLAVGIALTVGTATCLVLVNALSDSHPFDGSSEVILHEGKLYVTKANGAKSQVLRCSVQNSIIVLESSKRFEFPADCLLPTNDGAWIGYSYPNEKNGAYLWLQDESGRLLEKSLGYTYLPMGISPLHRAVVCVFQDQSMEVSACLSVVQLNKENEFQVGSPLRPVSRTGSWHIGSRGRVFSDGNTFAMLAPNGVPSIWKLGESDVEEITASGLEAPIDESLGFVDCAISPSEKVVVTAKSIYGDDIATCFIEAWWLESGKKVFSVKHPMKHSKSAVIEFLTDDVLCLFADDKLFFLDAKTGAVQGQQESDLRRRIIYGRSMWRIAGEEQLLLIHGTQNRLNCDLLFYGKR
jgi:hypothetical protein